MSSTPMQNNIWEAISSQTAELAQNAGNFVIAIQAGHRVAASGVHWKPGVIVTSAHLVRRADEVTVVIAEDKNVKGTIAGRDATTDLAVVKLADASTLSTPQFTSQAKVGELVLAVARSGRGELAASIGIVARVGATWRTWRGAEIERLLRPDVRLYPGQSGSALVNSRGEVLGINSALLARDSVITVPIETVDRVVNELLERGHIAQPYLGVALQQVALPIEWQKAAGTTQEHGLLVAHVDPEGPAQKAGIALGDVIVNINSHEVGDVRDILRGVARRHMESLRASGRRVFLNAPGLVGEKITVRLLRSGNVVETTLQLGDRPRR